MAMAKAKKAAKSKGDKFPKVKTAKPVSQRQTVAYGNPKIARKAKRGSRKGCRQ